MRTVSSVYCVAAFVVRVLAELNASSCLPPHWPPCWPASAAPIAVRPRRTAVTSSNLSNGFLSLSCSMELLVLPGDQTGCPPRASRTASHFWLEPGLPYHRKVPARCTGRAVRCKTVPGSALAPVESGDASHRPAGPRHHPRVDSLRVSARDADGPGNPGGEPRIQVLLHSFRGLAGGMLARLGGAHAGGDLAQPAVPFGAAGEDGRPPSRGEHRFRARPRGRDRVHELSRRAVRPRADAPLDHRLS